MKNIYAVLVICGIILLPTLLFPISCDISIYALGGRTLAEHGQLYVNFLDLKFPAIFELYSILYWTIGISEPALRFFDFIVQLLTCYVIYYIFIYRFHRAAAGALAAGIYALLYCSGRYGVTMQPDSYVGLVCCLAFLLLTSRRTILQLISIGVLSGFLFALKLTFAVVAIGVIIYFFAETDEKLLKRISHAGIVLAGSILTFLLTLLPLCNRNSFNEFWDIINYLIYYNSLMPFSGELIKESLKTIGTTFGDLISLFITFCAALGTLMIGQMHGKDKEIANRGGFYFLLLGALLFISIAVEKRFVYYHFYRIFVPLSLFAGFGLERLTEEFTSAIKRDGIAKITVIVLALFGIVLSPAARYGNLLPPSIYYFTSPAKYGAYYERHNGITMYSTHKSVAQYLDSIVDRELLAMVIATGGNQINYLRKDKLHSKFSQSAFLMGSFQVPKWRREFDGELHRAAALAVQTDDVHPTLTGFQGSSYDWLRQSEYWSYVNSHFKEIKRIGSFTLFRRLAS